MPPATHPQATPTPRRDGWTPQRRRQFLNGLAVGLDVRRACARVGLSRQAAYKLRERDAGFARAWGEALRAALAAHEQRFRSLVAEHLPWAWPDTAARPSGACQPGEGEARAGTLLHSSGACELRRAEAPPRSPADPAPALRCRAFGSRCAA